MPPPPTDDRFAFGKNWRRFLARVDDGRIEAAENGLRTLLQNHDLAGKTFLDIGSGSGLSSLVARRLGAYVRSFDYDLESVACTEEMKRRYRSNDADWIIEQGSALDEGYIDQLGTFDVVYSWGVLHHTGDMWRALALAERCVGSHGYLALSIYNDQDGASRRWRLVKKLYVKSPKIMKWLIVSSVWFFFSSRSTLIRLARLQNPLPFRDWRILRSQRGMAIATDLVDWVGGYPFEVAKPDEIFLFFRKRGYALEWMKTQAGGHGCNEFLFRRTRKPGLAQSIAQLVPKKVH